MPVAQLEAECRDPIEIILESVRKIHTSASSQCLSKFEPIDSRVMSKGQ